jgi:hypothetical protein
VTGKYIITVRGRDVGEGPWTSRKAATRFLNTEVGARGARVVRIVHTARKAAMSRKKNRDPQSMWNIFANGERVGGTIYAPADVTAAELKSQLTAKAKVGSVRDFIGVYPEGIKLVKEPGLYYPGYGIHTTPPAGWKGRVMANPRAKPTAVLLAHDANPDLADRGGYWAGDPGGPRRQTVPVSSFEEASRVCQAYIGKHELGGGNWTGGAIYDGRGKQIAYVSYNGRVWPGKASEWKPGAKEIPLKKQNPGRRLRWHNPPDAKIVKFVPDGDGAYGFEGSALQRRVRCDFWDLEAPAGVTGADLTESLALAVLADARKKGREVILDTVDVTEEGGGRYQVMAYTVADERTLKVAEAYMAKHPTYFASAPARFDVYAHRPR